MINKIKGGAIILEIGPNRCEEVAKIYILSVVGCWCHYEVASDYIIVSTYIWWYYYILYKTLGSRDEVIWILSKKKVALILQNYRL